MKKLNFTTTGTCAREIEIECENGIIGDVSFLGGCNGNLKGISSLVKGMRIEDAISKLEGITCKDKPTSCPDQLTIALREILKTK